MTSSRKASVMLNGKLVTRKIRDLDGKDAVVIFHQYYLLGRKQPDGCYEIEKKDIGKD